MWNFMMDVLMLSFPPNNSLLCDINFYYAKVFILLLTLRLTSQLENAYALTDIHEYFTLSYSHLIHYSKQSGI